MKIRCYHDAIWLLLCHMNLSKIADIGLVVVVDVSGSVRNDVWVWFMVRRGGDWNRF